MFSKYLKKKTFKFYWEAQFKEDFIENDNPDSKQQLRDAIFEEIKQQDNSKMSNDDLKIFLKSVKLNLIFNFYKSEEVHADLPTDWMVIKEDDINDFLKCFVLLVNQPNVIELMAQVCLKQTSEINIRMGKTLDKIGLKLSVLAVQKLGMYCMSESRKQWLVDDRILQFVDEQKKVVFVTVITLINEYQIMRYKIYLKRPNLSATFHEYFEYHKANVMYFCTNNILLSAVKILEFLAIRTDFRQIYISLNDMNYKKVKDSVEKVFKSNNFYLLIIECRNSPISTTTREILEGVFTISDSLTKNKIILIMKNGEAINMTHFPRAKTVEIMDNVSFSDFDLLPNYEIKPFTQVQSLAKLTCCSNRKSYKNYLYKSSIQDNLRKINTTTLIKVINDHEREIENEPKETWTLEGECNIQFEEIDRETFARKLLSEGISNDAEYIYIISGISGSSNKEKISKLVQYLEIVDEQESIEKKLGETGSDSEVQITDDQFKEENFEKLCHSYPEKRIFWICVQNVENTLKFVLQLFYNPKFYLKRKFKDIVIKDLVKHQLIDSNLSERYILYHTKNKQEVFDSLNLTDEFEKNLFDNNCEIGKIELVTSEADAEDVFKKNIWNVAGQCVHLLKFDKQQIFWCNSYGSVRNIEQCIDRKQSEISLTKKNNFVREFINRQTVIIADNPGMGKTTTLTKLCDKKDESENNKFRWVVRINSKNLIQYLRLRIYNTDVIDIISQLYPKRNRDVVLHILKYALDKNKKNSNSLLFVIEEIDKILDADSKWKVLSFLKILKEKTAAKLWIKVNKYSKLTSKYDFPFTLELDPMNYKSVVKYIKKYLEEQLRLLISEEKFSELFIQNDERNKTESTQKCTEIFLSKIESVLKRNVFRLYGNLQLHLMIEDSESQISNFSYLGNDVWEVFRSTVLPVTIDTFSRSSEKFIHATVRDYFAAKVFFDFISKEEIDLLYKTTLEYLLKEILIQSYYHPIRSFINVILKKFSKPTLLKECLYRFRLTDEVGRALHVAVKEGNTNIALYVLNTLKEDKKLLKNILFKVDEYQCNALHVACSQDDVEVVKILLDAAAGISEETLQEYLCCLNGNRAGPFDEAIVGSSNPKILKELLSRTKNKLDLILIEETENSHLILACVCGKEEFVKTLLREFEQDEYAIKKLLLYMDLFGNALYWAVKHTSIAEYLLGVAMSMKDNNETLRHLLLPEKGDLPVKEAIAMGNVEVVRMLIDAAKKIEDDNNTLKKMLFNRDRHYSTLSEAVKGGNCDIIKLLLETAAALGKETLEKLIFAGDENGDNVVLSMVKHGHEESFADSFKILEDSKYQAIYKKVKHIFETISLADRLHTVQENLHDFVYKNCIADVKKVLDQTQCSDVSPDEKLKILLLSVDDELSQCNVLHTACERGHFELIKELISYSMSINDEGRTFKELVTSLNSENKTPFETLTYGYTIEIKQIAESLTQEALSTNNEHAVNILQDIFGDFSKAHSLK